MRQCDVLCVNGNGTSFSGPIQSSTDGASNSVQCCVERERKQRLLIRWTMFSWRWLQWWWWLSLFWKNTVMRTAKRQTKSCVNGGSVMPAYIQWPMIDDKLQNENQQTAIRVVCELSLVQWPSVVILQKIIVLDSIITILLGPSGSLFCGGGLMGFLPLANNEI